MEIRASVPQPVLCTIQDLCNIGAIATHQRLACCTTWLHKKPMQKPRSPANAEGRRRAVAKTSVTVYGYARVSTGGQSVDAQVRELRAAGAATVFREVASGAKTDRPQLGRLLSEIAAGDVGDRDAA
jgi:hypothetical protein